jgi:tape measure domain-containing protein
MPSIDERVVSMAFENSVFEQRVSVTMTTLSKLDTALKNMGTTTGFEKIETSANKVTLQGPMSALDKLKSKLGLAGQGAAEGFGEIDKAGNKVTLEGPSSALDKLKAKFGLLSAGTAFTDIEKASDRTTLSGLSNTLDNVTAKFSLLQGAAAVALGNITSQAVMRGGVFAKSFSFGPLQQGLEEYQTNLNSIQTILSNTEGQQVSGLKNVNKYLGELNTYSDQTIYNFSQMAKNIGTFTAAGVDLPKATASIKGIANLAALSGSNSQQAATAMYQLSQSIAAGKVGLQDWNSVVNAGMGGAVFQKALLRTADNMGTIEKGALKIDEATGKATVNGQSFRESIMAKPGEESWLTSDVLTRTLEQFTGDMKEADLIAQGFSKTQAQAIMQQATTAKAAATEVKTLSQVFDIARETIGSGWAKSFQLIFGDFEQAKKTFTDLSNFINGFINRVSDARNEILGEWGKLGGRLQAIEGIKAAFEALMSIITPIKDAFREIFPATTGKQLFDLTVRFKELMENLKIGPETADGLRRTFAGLFAVLHIGWTIVKEVAGVIFDLLDVVGEGSGGFLNFTGSIGDFLVSLDEAISKGKALEGFFNGITAVLRVPLEILKALASAFFGLFDGADESKAEGVAKGLDQVKESLSPLEGAVNTVKDAWEGLVDILGKAQEALSPWISQLRTEISNFVSTIGDVLDGADWETVFAGIQTGILGGLFIVIKKALGGGVKDIGGGLLGNVNDMLGGFTKNLEAMQSKIHAEALLAIAGAVTVLAAGIYVLSTIDGDKLAKAMTATAVGLAQLVGALKLMSAGAGKAGILLLPVMAAGLIGVATAALILSGAVKIFSTMDWDELARGLAGLGGALVAVGLGVRLIGPSIVPAALALIPLAIGLNILAVAVKQFGEISWKDLAKGLVGIGGALVAIGLAMQLMPPTLLITGAGLVVVAAGLVLLSAAVATFGGMDPGKLAQGILGIALSLTAIGLAVALIPPTLALQAAGLVVLGIALTGIAAAVAIFGSMDLGKLAKGIASIAGVLVVLGLGLTAMSGTIPGSVALLAAAAAFAILGPTLAFMGTLKWSTIFKGLAAIALVLGTLAVVGALAAAPLIALGGALAVLGLGMSLISASAYILAKAFALLGDVGAKGVTTLLVALTAFIAVLPTIVINFLKGLVEIVAAIAKIAPLVLTALGKMLGDIIAFVVAQAPKLGVAITALITMFLDIINKNVGPIIQAGWNLILNFLKGISDHIGEVVATAGTIIARFLTSLVSQLPKIISAGVNLVTKFLEGIANKAFALVSAAANLIAKFLGGIAQKIPDVIASAGKLITTFVTSIVNQLPKLIRSGVSIITKFIEGIGQAIPDILKAGVRVVRNLLNGIAQTLPDLADAGFKAIIKFLNGVERAIRENDDALIDAGFGVADAIIDGMVKGFKELGHRAVEAVGDVISELPKKALDILDMRSPSKVFMTIGRNTMWGLAKGIDDNKAAPAKSVSDTVTGMVNALGKISGVNAPSEITRRVGKEIGAGFAKGLTGSQSDIRGAFSTLRSQLNDEIKTTREQVETDKTQLEEELSKKQKDQDPQLINDLRSAIVQNTADLAKMTTTRRFLNQGLKEERAQLLSLSSSYKTISDRLEKAKEALKAIIAERDQAAKAFTDKYSVTPSIGPDTSLADYNKQLQDRIAAVQKYHATLQALRAAGLDDTTYRQLLEQGVEGQKFADELLAGGKAAIDQINVLDKDLQSASKTLGDAAAHNLYAAGVKAAQGLVKGLKKEKDTLKKLMDDLADAMVKALKAKLKIKSPSEIFAEMGQFMTEGLARGLEDSSKVTEAATKLGEDVLSSMSAAIANNVDVDPVISPVLDLANVEQEAGKLGEMLPTPTLTAATSVDQATRISDQQAALEALVAAPVVPTQTFSFEQNNYSPDPLSNIEIYRQTNNQMSRLKSALGVT